MAPPQPRNSDIQMKIKKQEIAILAVAILIGTIGAAFIDWYPRSVEPILNTEDTSSQNIWNAVSCRARLYLKKAESEVSELSMMELWELTRPGRGFNCAEGGG